MSVTVPSDATVAVLVGHMDTRRGVVAAVGGEVRVLPLPGHEALVYTMKGRQRPNQDAEAFVRGLTRSLRWMSWAREVRPGETIEPSSPEEAVR